MAGAMPWRRNRVLPPDDWLIDGRRRRRRAQRNLDDGCSLFTVHCLAAGNFLPPVVSNSQQGSWMIALVLYGTLAAFVILLLPGWRQAGPASHRHQRQNDQRRPR